MVRRTSVGYKSLRKVPCISGVDTAMYNHVHMVDKGVHSSVCIADDRSSYGRVLNKAGRYGHRRPDRHGHRTVYDCT